MLNNEFRLNEEILLLRPEGSLEAADFTMLAGLVDAYLERNRKLRRVLIKAKSFPGWNDFGALLAHLKFVKAHHQDIEKVAVVADGAVANIMPNIANHFVHAQVLHFDLESENAAWIWLKENSKLQMYRAA